MTDPTPPASDPALDPELARWLERSEAFAFADLYAATAALPVDPVGAQVAPIGDGVAVAMTAFDIGFFNRAVGIGTTGRLPRTTSMRRPDSSSTTGAPSPWSTCHLRS